MIDSRGGYLVVGDALCSFNPLYGQGMSVAALDALLLERLLREHDGDLGGRYFPAAASLVDTPWNLTTAGDLQFAHVEGEPSPEMLEMEEYLQRYREVAVDDAVLAAALLRVFNLLDEPSRLSEPDLRARVSRGAGPVVAPASRVGAATIPDQTRGRLG
ncbi:hypothetical protein [Actinopolymorpha pittospori]|uniref:Flavin-dependent dehydrogenase n=1 Tax=Actinopolymorpha pittospori TaxID=648752 RepID=A0A927R824_9ACTN|nr:hypothetical protein [Actinopolymorpha pittospori]MBE1604879.1 flavin-dependent dehydrogenase [Actinopolymorpha pittospori]